MHPARSSRSFKTGGLPWQGSLKVDLLYCKHGKHIKCVEGNCLYNHLHVCIFTHCQVSRPRLQSVLRPTMSKQLKGLPRLPIFFQWEDGRVGRVFAAGDDSTLAVNIKKGIVSLFQLQVEDGTHDEVYSKICTCMNTMGYL